MPIIELVKVHQQKIVLTVGFLLVAVVAFGLGRTASPHFTTPEIRVEEAFSAPDNYNPNISGAQTIGSSIDPRSATTSPLSCNGQIKGSSSMLYHLPGGAFYNKTTKPIRCFATEAEAQAAGFKKSSR